MRDAGVAVEQAALLCLVKAAECLALRMDQREFRGQGTQHGNRGRLIVYINATLAVALDFASQNDLTALGIDPVFLEDLLGPQGALEDAGDHGFFSSMTNHVRRGLFSHQQRQCIHKDRLAGSRLSGQQVQSRSEDRNGMVDHRVILGP